jgi:hypothetical protein
MDNLAETLFGPLGKDYCIYFYYLSMIGMFLLAILVASTLFIGISQRKNFGFYLQMLSVALGYAIFYFQNRLLHSMCVGMA